MLRCVQRRSGLWTAVKLEKLSKKVPMSFQQLFRSILELSTTEVKLAGYFVELINTKCWIGPVCVCVSLAVVVTFLKNCFPENRKKTMVKIANCVTSADKLFNKKRAFNWTEYTKFLFYWVLRGQKKTKINNLSKPVSRRKVSMKHSKRFASWWNL